MADVVTYQESLASAPESTPFVKKTWTTLNDSNNSQYTSNQIRVDASAFVNSGNYIDWSQAYLVIPLILTLYPTAAVSGFDTASNSNWSAAFKSNFLHLIDSLSVTLNGTTVVRLCSTQSIFYNFKMLQQMSAGDLASIPNLGFYPDTSTSWTYNASASVDGHGVCHNKPWGCHTVYPNAYSAVYAASAIDANTFPATSIGTAVSTLWTGNYPATTDTIQTIANEGLFRRQLQIGFNPAVAPYSSLLSAANTSLIFKNYFQSIANGTTTDAGCKVYRVNSVIRLRDMCDLFSKLPLVKGLLVQLLLNINQGTATITTARVGGGSGVLAHTTMTASSVSASYGIFPAMITSLAPTQPNSTMDTVGSKTFKLTCAVVRTTPAGATGNTTELTCPSTTCTLHAPQYQMNAAAENEYLSLHKTKRIIYKDLTNYNIFNIAASSTFNVLVSNGISQPVSVTIFPFYNASANGSGFGISPLLSPFDSSPSTTSPLCPIYNYNVYISGMALYQESLNYTYDQFIQEVSQYDTLNGNLVDALGSGLISQVDWENKYCVVVSDLTRRVMDDVPRSIQLVGKNMSSKAVDYYCFIENLNEITIELATGNLV